VWIGLPGDQGSPSLNEALDRIADHSSRREGPSEVLLMGRYKHLRPRHMATLKARYPGLCFSWKTIHGSKGLEADYAVVLGVCAGKHGFPAEMEDEPLRNLVLAAPEAHPDAEERRLLYVALTRAKRQVFLLAGGGAPSSFVNELIEGGYDVAIFGRPPEGCSGAGGGRESRTRSSTRTSAVSISGRPRSAVRAAARMASCASLPTLGKEIVTLTMGAQTRMSETCSRATMSRPSNSGLDTASSAARIWGWVMLGMERRRSRPRVVPKRAGIPLYWSASAAGSLPSRRGDSTGRFAG